MTIAACAVLLCLLPSIRADGDPTPDDPIPLAQAERALREAEEAALADDGALWGRPLVGPMLLADPATRFVVANRPDEEGRLEERGGLFVGTLPEAVGIANTGTDWAGVRWTMVMWPLPENRYARLRLLLHEAFHRVQPELGHGGGDALCAHLDGEPGRTWLRLEFRALAEALIRSGPARERAQADALLFRARRRALFPEAREREAAFERNEGLAEYTGLVLCGYPRAVLADRAAQKLEQDEASASFVRSFAYATGPAWGILLDERGVTWRATLDPRSDLAETLATAVEWKAPADLAGEADRRAASYDGERVIAAERRRAAERARLDARNRARYVEGPVLSVPFGPELQYTFDFRAITPLEGVGNVYGSVRVTDAWGILDASEGGALFVTTAGGAFEAARVPAPSDAKALPLSGEGWTLTLAEGWVLAPGERAGDWRVVRAP